MIIENSYQPKEEIKVKVLEQRINVYEAQGYESYIQSLECEVNMANVESQTEHSILAQHKENFLKKSNISYKMAQRLKEELEKCKTPLLPES